MNCSRYFVRFHPGGTRPPPCAGWHEERLEAKLDFVGGVLQEIRDTVNEPHPDHPARPSPYDLDHAWPVFTYVIVAVEGGEPRALTSWRLRDDRSAFDEEPVVVEPSA